MNIKYIETHVIYACDKCCSKVEHEGELCWHCHEGHGVQVDPVICVSPKEARNESKAESI